MKTFTCLILVYAVMAFPGHAAPASPDETGCQLTVELRDGSRLVGQCLDSALSFHSDTVGDVKLPWASIKAIDYTNDSGTVHLSAANGDELNVQLSSNMLNLQTGFGKTELPMKLIRSIKVASAPKPNAFSRPGTTGKSALVLEVALNDGSQIIGKGLNESLNFHANSVGDLKLTWADVRSLDLKGKDSSSPARLVTTKGEIYEGQFSADSILIQASFGKNELPAKLINHINVSNEGDSAEHLLGWWKLDEGSGTVAKDSNYGHDPHDGTLANNPAWVQTPGQNEWSLQFNGGNQHVTPGNVLQDGYPEISIACWVRHTGSAAEDIIARSVWDNPDGIGMTVDGNSVMFGHYNKLVRSKASIQDGQWHHLVGTMIKDDNDSQYTYSIYVDGQLDSTATQDIGLTSTTAGWGFGGRQDGSWGFHGLLQDVRIYDRALSAPEVEAIYAEQDHGNPPPSPPSPPGVPQPTQLDVEDANVQAVLDNAHNSTAHE